jgi:UDP-N-acetylglucosamine:LPS N-acetylglucosamine transferase
MTRLLILSSDTGEGHNSAAAAIKSAADAAGLSARIRKPLEESTPINRSLASLYNVLLTHRPQWMSAYSRLLASLRPNERDIFYSKVRPYIGRFIDSEKPDTLLSVHPMMNHFVQRFIKESGLDIPCFTFLTDPFPPFWRAWASPYVDRYFVPTDEALQALTALGTPAWRIERVPMPVRRRFAPATAGELRDFRSALRLDTSETILINGGARGGGPLLRIYRTIRRAAAKANILVVCGKNSRLRWKIEREQHPRTRAFGFLEDIHRYIAASDLVLTKPGALSTYEALACRVPVMLVGMRGLMPQESGLFEAASHYDFAYAARSFEDVERIVRAGPAEWNRKREALPYFYRASSGEELIQRIQPAHASA